MNRLSKSKLSPLERKAITAFSRRLKKLLGNQLLSIKLFGSKVRGDDHKDSDIDIYVLIRRQSITSLSKVARVTSAIWWDFDVLLSTVTFDLEEQAKNLAMHSFFFEAVEREGVRI